jgi:chromate reductase, NAD(P)H dehydrogenase (quinone)
MAELGATFELYDQMAMLPHFDGREDAPIIVQEFRTKVRESNGVLICTPEYAFGVPGTLKNALDWTVGTGDFVNKPVALITASSQGEKGHEAMQWILQAISTRLDHKLLISFIRSKVKEGQVVDEKTREEVIRLAQSFVRSI